MEDKYIRISRAIIDTTSNVTDEQIDEAINKVSVLYPNVDRDELKMELLSLYGVIVKDYQILEGSERRRPWLGDFKAERKSSWLFWSRYKEYLSEQRGYPNIVVQRLDNMTDKVLDNLFNPQLTNTIIAKKGLVVGQVQSGKTSNYIGLICKAADAGFNFIVVLAGILNNLRSQTQSRIDEGFLGFDTQFERAYNRNTSTKIGVGTILGDKYKRAIANSYTTSRNDGDFNSKAANTAGFNFNTPQPIILVVKKNASVLKRLNRWLMAQSGDAKITDKSLLLIDDEADNASINTNAQRDDLDPTAINDNIRKLLDRFNRSAYVGYTATPFANIFIAQDETDLFPRDFIINLPAPSNYIGPEKVFGTTTDIDDNEDLLPIVIPVDDYEDFIPDNHKKDDPKPSLEDMPESLKKAIKCFILTCAIRLARGQENKHNSMLIHVSRFQSWQNAVKDLVESQYRYYKQEIESNDTLVLKEFRKLLEGDYTKVTNSINNSSLSDLDKNLKVHSWEEIGPLLYNVVQKIEVKSINGSSKDVLDYQLAAKKGLSVIVIGGDKLSRGLTLEGLSISYFLRSSKMYDTLMQMGRWFGYRSGYIDLCRLFTSAEINEWYRHITLASEELIDEFNYLAESGSTPENYALKVRTHPGELQITAINKMRNTRDIQVSWATRLVETYQLPMDKGQKNHNLVATDDFLRKLGNGYAIKNGNYLWKDVSPTLVCDYLRDFNLPKTLKKVDLEVIVKYIEGLNEFGELTNWSVALMSKTRFYKKGEKVKEYRFCDSLDVKCFLRNRANDTDYNTYFIRKNHIVGNTTDEFIDLEDSTLEKALNASVKEAGTHGQVWREKYPKPILVRSKYRPITQPLLIIYPLDPRGAEVANGTVVHTSDEIPFVGFAASFPRTNTNYAVSYRVNLVSEFADVEDNFDNENDNDYGKP